jgi:PAS domain S-box-containing protein
MAEGGSGDLEDELERLRRKCDSLTRELEEARLYRRAVENSPLPTMCVSGPKGRYQFINEAFARMLGLSLDEVSARDPFQVFAASAHPDEFEHERHTLERMARGELDSHRFEKRMVVEGQERHYQLDVFATRDAQGRLEFLTGFFTDIETRRTLDQARQRFEKDLLEAQKLGTVGKLAGGIAHDFNNRLTIIMGHAELMKRGAARDSALVGHADMVLSSARRAAELTQQLLAYSRRQVLNPGAFDLNEMVARMERVLSTALGERVELSTVLGAERPVVADPGQIEQVILNLALNARDAMMDGGSIVIETRDVTLRANDHATLGPGDYVALIVSDTGSGIADEIRPHIFEPFFTTKEKGQGTGLGLSMVEGIVSQSGGAIDVRSAVGQGTAFTILLPRARENQAPPRPKRESSPPHVSNFETVLVCDDEPEVRKLLTRVLGLRGYTVLSAGSAKEALAIASRYDGPIQLLVTDIAMPEMDGFQLASELRQLHRHAAVLYISGYTENAEKLSVRLGPNTQYLAKPFLPGDLTSLVSSMLEQTPERQEQ